MTHLKSTDVAHRYFVTDCPEAFTPATRLRNALDSLQQGGQLSSFALSYLRKQGLTALERLARGEVTYEAFCDFAQAEQNTRRISAEVAKAAKEAESKAAEAAWAVQYALERQRAMEARIALENDPQHIRKIRNQQTPFDMTGSIPSGGAKLPRRGFNGCQQSAATGQCDRALG